MRAWLIRLTSLLVVFALVCLGVVIYWQTTSRLPSESDLFVYFILLPLAVTAACWGIYKLVTRTPAEPSLASKNPPISAEAQAAVVTERNAAMESNWTLHILGTALVTSAGDSASEVLGKLKGDQIEPQLDVELKNADGFAVFSARVQDLDFTQTAENLAEWQKNAEMTTQKTSGQSALLWRDAQLRALHLALACLQPLLSQAAEHKELQAYIKRLEDGRAVIIDALPTLRLVLQLPADWSEAHKQLAVNWFKFLAVRSGWPEVKISALVSSSLQSDPVALLDHIMVSARRANLPALGILLACDSSIDQSCVDKLVEVNLLFGGTNANGVKPGEVAAGLFFADALQTKMLEDVPFSVFHRPSWAQRDKSADERGRGSFELLGRLVGLALQTSGTKAGDLKQVATDVDHRVSRVSELAEMLTLHLPDLDLSDDVIKVAQTCGSVSHASMAATLCVAHEHVLNEQTPVLCLSLHDALLRVAVVLNVPSMRDAALPFISS